MDLVTRTDLEQLGRRGQPGTHVSLFIPTHRFGDGIQADRIRWKNLVSQTESVLAEQGLRQADIAELLRPARALQLDAVSWQYMSDGLALFMRPGWHRAFRVPADLPAVGAVGGHFMIAPMLRLLAGDQHFLVLALSQREVRLLEGSMLHLEQLDLRDVPTSLREVIEPAEPRSEAMTRMTASSVGGGGRAGRAVFYGHGAADDRVKKDEARRFIGQVADGLRGYLAGQHLPMVPVGLDYLVAMYREANAYPHLTSESALVNPDGLSDTELHAAAWPVAAPVLERKAREAAASFRRLHGTGRASDDPKAIADAAREGRVESLLMAAQPGFWERFTADAPVVRLGEREQSARWDLADRAAADTLTRGGQVHVLEAADMPGDSDIAAVFRH